MRHTNLLLLRLNRAVDCSNSKYLSEKALSIILFDNIVETQLHYLLTEDKIYEKEYSDFVASMCYGAKDEVITFEKALNNFKKLYESFDVI